MSWLPPNERDTRYNIWYKKYKCRLRLIETKSIDELREFGMPTVFDKDYDSTTANEMVIRMLTINEMVEYYKKNVTIYVVNYNDTKLIYEDIMLHLRAWKEYLDTTLMSSGDAPVEDLILLDKFANIVYKHAVYLFTDDYIKSSLITRMTSVIGLNLGNSGIADKTPDRKEHKTIFKESIPGGFGKPGLGSFGNGLTKWG